MKASYVSQWSESLQLTKTPLDMFFGTNVGYMNVVSFKENEIIQNLMVSSKDRSKNILSEAVQTHFLSNEDLYISVNSFGFQGNRLEERNFIKKGGVANAPYGFRRTNNLRQLRAFAIDIDQYQLGLDLEFVTSEIERLIGNDIIPKPNLLMKSRGLQLIYILKNGVAPTPTMVEYVHSVSSTFVERLRYLGADKKALLPTQLVRFPNSVNVVRDDNNHVVQKIPVETKVLESEPYSLTYLKQYRDKLKHTNRKKIQIEPYQNRNKVTKVSLQHAIDVNLGRIRFLEKLIEVRPDMKGYRERFIYVYVFQLTLYEVMKAYRTREPVDIFNKVKNRLLRVFDKYIGPSFPRKELDYQTLYSYQLSIRFFRIFERNHFKIYNNANDGIIKPYQKETLLTIFDIDEKENAYIEKLLISDKNKRYYEQKKKKKWTASERKREIVKLLEEKPQLTNRELAEYFDVSRKTIQRDKKELAL